MAAINKVDNEATKLLLCAERGCRKLRTGAVDYSLILSKLGLRWRFWRKVTHYYQKRFFDLEYLRKVASYLQIDSFLSVPVAQCIFYLKEAKVEYLI